MKVLTTLFLVGCLQSMAAGYAQKVTLSERDSKIEKVFKEIRRQTGYQFLYTTKMVENAKKVTIDVKDAPLEDALTRCFQEQPFTYEIKDKTIIIKSKSVPQPLPLKPEPPIDVKGRLTNEKGEPVAGASISVKGTLTRVLTNTNGEFSLMGVEENAILYVSHVQYEDATLQVNGSPLINASLATRVSSLDETQVIAYGTVTKRLNSGNVYTVKARDLTKQPVTNPLQALQGRVPGLQIVQETGVPGGSFSVIIRGRNSVVNGTDPLYIVDGVPYNSQILPNGASSQGSTVASSESIGSGGKVPSPLNYLNLNDIESIDVLKDADATAIYGSRGANGVILITTKKGKTGKTNVDLNVYSGVAQVSNKMKMMNADQFRLYRRESFANDKATPGTADSDLNGTWDSTLTVDWQDQFIGGNASYTDAQASISGGSADVQYYIGGGYHKENTVNPGDFKNERGSIHFTLTTSSQNKKLKTQLSGKYLTSLNFLPFNDMMNYTRYYPIAPKSFDDNGNLNWESNQWNNPWQWLMKYSKAKTKNLLGNFDISYEILSGLTAKVTGGYSDIQFNDLNVTPQTSIRPNSVDLKGQAEFSWNSTRSWIVEPQLQYKFQVSDGKFEALIGATVQQNRSEGMKLNGTGYIDDDLLETLAGASTITKSSLYDQIYKYNAGFARIKYNWQDKYIAHLTARRDGSSRFGPGKQFNNFGAIGAAWLFSNEDFVRDLMPLLSYGKFRASYGTTGSDQMPDYRFIDTYAALGGQPYSAPYQSGNPAYYPDNLYNADLAWEVNKKFEAGVELGLAKDRFFFSASYFNNRSSNQLVVAPLPDITGFNGWNMNLPALVENSGLEFMFRTYNIKTKDFSWVSNFNITKQQNKLVEFPGLESSPSYVNSLVIGQPLSVRRLYDIVGVDPTKGIYTFRSAQYGKDTSRPFSSGVTDKYILKNTDAEFYGGFQNTFTYKNFELDIFLQFVKQVAPNPLFIGANQPGFYSKLQYHAWPSEILDSRWQQEGDIATFQRFSRAAVGTEINDAYNAAKNSELGWVDASFIRLKNASFSYRLPEKLVKQMRLQNVRIYVQGQNLFTFTKYKGYDPETGLTAFPPLRVMTGGIQVNL